MPSSTELGTSKSLSHHLTNSIQIGVRMQTKTCYSVSGEVKEAVILLGLLGGFGGQPKRPGTTKHRVLRSEVMR
jgi:hypothetical protein